MKNKPIFQKSRKVETDTKTLWQYELCNDHQIKVVIHTIYAIYREMKKTERKTNYFAKNTKKNPIKKLEKKNRSAREKKFVYLLICENNKTKQKLLLSLSILVVFWSILHTTFLIFWCSKKQGKLQKTKEKSKLIWVAFIKI